MSLVQTTPRILCMDDRIEQEENVPLVTLPLEVTYRILKHCIDKDSLVNTNKNLTFFNTTPRFFALLTNTQICRFFIQECAALFTHGNSAHLFQTALSNHCFTLAQMILQSGLTSIDHKNEYGYTQLMLATYQYHLSAMQFLINAGADLEIQNFHGDTALEIIARRPGWNNKSKKKALKLLIHAGANIKRAKKLAETAGNPSLFLSCTIL